MKRVGSIDLNHHFQNCSDNKKINPKKKEKITFLEGFHLLKKSFLFLQQTVFALHQILPCAIIRKPFLQVHGIRY